MVLYQTSQWQTVSSILMHATNENLHPLTFCSWLNCETSCCALQKWLVINFQSLMALLSAPGSWINKNLIAPLNHLKVIPLSGTFNIISDTTGWFWDLSGRKTPSEGSLISFPQAKQCPSLNQAVQWIIITARLNWTHCCRAGKPVLSADWFMSCESKILQKTYHHSFVLLSVYRPLSIDDYYIERSLISGFCVQDKWKTKGRRCAARSKRESAWWVNIFNYGVRYKMKGNISEQISLKVTFVWKSSASVFSFPVLSIRGLCCREQAVSCK